MPDERESGPRHLCDDCSDRGQVFHVMVMKTCNRNPIFDSHNPIFGGQIPIFDGQIADQEEDEQNGRGQAGQEPLSEGLGSGAAPPGFDWLW